MARHVADLTTTKFENLLKFFYNSVAELFSTSKAYVVNDFVIYDGLLYQCKEDCAAGAWDANKWTVQKIFDNDGYFILESKEGAE